MTENGRAMASMVCKCGRRKIGSRSFCIRCFKTLPAEFHDRMKNGDSKDRDRAYHDACKWLEAEWFRTEGRMPLFLDETQLFAIFLGANIDGKRIAVQALVDWEQEGA